MKSEDIIKMQKEWIKYNSRLWNSEFQLQMKYEKLKSEYKNLAKDYEDLVTKLQNLLNSAK